MNIRKTYIALLCLLLVVSTALAAESPKREMRSAWLTTAWAIDWPKTRGQGMASQQQDELRAIIDKLHKANFNAVFFQVRSFSDAMYESSYEPWSQYLTGTRGEDSGYDPLALAVEYAHSLGMELHAWINPYRYSSSDATYGNGEDDYANTHPEWIMHSASNEYTTILNPGIPEVRDQIAKVIAEIVTNYDIDGVLFDDYFYINGETQNSEDQEYYEQYNPNNLSRGDWRREQVNLMVEQVYTTIKSIKPYCRFGISPAGVAATSQTVADKYGVECAPVSSDWQYDGIYSDPLAWISSHHLDYISPQIYWPIGAKADYDQLCNWWSKVANKFGRHFYSSSSLSDLGSLGNQQYVDQVALNRAYDRNGATGSVFYGISSGLNSSTFMQYIAENSFTQPALPPRMTWYEKPTQDLYVENITLSGRWLTWEEPLEADLEEIRYAVYSIPKTEVGKAGTIASSKYLLGIAYDSSYTLDEDPSEDNVFAISVFDRYGYEHPAVIAGQSVQTLTAAKLVYPEDKGTPFLPCYFTWEAVNKADSYVFQFSTDATFDTIRYECETPEPRFNVGNITTIEEGVTYYWRVVSRGVQATDTYSEVRSFSGRKFALLYPSYGETDVSLTPEFRCDSLLTTKATYTFEVSVSNAFTEDKVVYTKSVNVPRVTVTDELLPSTLYYVRVRAQEGAMNAISDAHQFKTLTLPTPSPTILSPADGDTIVGTEVIVMWEEQIANEFMIELAIKENFPSRTTLYEFTDARTYTCTFRDVEPGDYFLRVNAGAEGSYVESEIRKIVVIPATGVDDLDNHTIYVTNGILFAPAHMKYNVYSVDGRLLTMGTTVSSQTILDIHQQGLYILQVGNQVMRYQVW